MNTHTEFITQYCQRYQQRFGSPYLFNGGKDGSAIKRLIGAGITVDDAIKLLDYAFAREGYPWDAAATIAGFVSSWPYMVARRSRPSPPTRWDLQRQIDLVKEQIQTHPHNPESIHEDRAAKVDVSLEKWRSKLEELKRQYAML